MDRFAFCSIRISKSLCARVVRIRDNPIIIREICGSDGDIESNTLYRHRMSAFTLFDYYTHGTYDVSVHHVDVVLLLIKRKLPRLNCVKTSLNKTPLTVADRIAACAVQCIRGTAARKRLYNPTAAPRVELNEFTSTHTKRSRGTHLRFDVQY